MIKPYDFRWHRRLDFIPPLGLQVVVGDGDLELYYCFTSVSVKESAMPRVPREAQTAFGTLKVSPIFRNQVDYEMGRPNPRNGLNPITQREILDDIYNNIGGAVNLLGDIPDVVIKSRGVVEKIPPAVEDLAVFQGSENVFYHQNAYGNFPHKIRQAFGLAVANPYYFTKADLMENHILTTGHEPVLKKLRSTLKTEYILTDASGYNSIGDLGILSLEQALVQRRWWTDIGKPTPFQIPIDHTGLEGQVFRLLRRDMLVAV